MQELLTHLATVNPEALLVEGFSDALVGIANHHGETVAVYDRATCVSAIQVAHSCSLPDAEHLFKAHTHNLQAQGRPIFATFPPRNDTAEQLEHTQKALASVLASIEFGVLRTERGCAPTT